MKRTLTKETFDDVMKFQLRVTELEARYGAATQVECLKGLTRVTWRRLAMVELKF